MSKGQNATLIFHTIYNEMYFLSQFPHKFEMVYICDFYLHNILFKKNNAIL